MPKAGERPAALEQLEPDDPLTVLIPLFLLETAVPRAAAAQAVDVADVVALGLVEDGPELVPLVRLVPSGHAVFVSDLEHGGGHEHVLGVTPSSALLGNLQTAQLTYLSPNLKDEIGRLDFFNVGIFKIAPEKSEAGSEAITASGSSSRRWRGCSPNETSS